METKSKVLWPLLATALLVTIFLAPQPTLAQGERTDLSLRLTPYRYNVEVTPGEDNIFYLEVKNEGTTTITNIALSSTQPEDWVIDFKPDRIDSLSPDSLKIVDVNIRPPQNTTRERIKIDLIATTNEMRGVESIWVTVKTASIWLWVGIGAIVVVVAIFVLFFFRLSRQK